MKVLITGATSGIGAALAQLLQSEGHEVLAIGRREGDLATPEGRASVAEIIQQELPDVVINNAGRSTAGAAANHSIADEQEQLAVNVTAVLELTLAAVHAWKGAGRNGTVVNVASVAGFGPMPLVAGYGASKAYVLHLSEALDAEMEGTGIRVLCACPGLVRTGFHQRMGGNRQIVLPKNGVMSAEYTAGKILKQLLRGKRLQIYSPRYQAIPLLARLLPRSFWLRLSLRWRRKSVK